MKSYEKKTLEKLLNGELPFSEIHAIMSSFKDPDRFEKMLSIYQARVEWDDKIVLPYGENLFIVQKRSEECIVKCVCGHEFGDYRRNWKLSALVYVRDTQAKMDQIYPKMMSANPDWMELREFYCPGCKRQLEVEAVPPGYPIIFDFQPDLETFYRDWLGRPLENSSP